MARRETGVSGLSEMLETLRNLPEELGSKGGGPTRSALFQAAKIWKESAEDLAPVSDDTDDVKLNKNIISKRDPRPNLNEYSERYSITYNNRAWWGGFPELGTSQQPAQSYLRATFDQKGDEALAKFADTFRRRLDAAVKKARAA